MPEYYVGQPVWWLWTPGGGGGSGHRKTEKERRPARVINIGPRRVYIQVDNGRETWVNRSSLEARTNTPT